MNKKEIDSILMLNLYFTSCKIQNPYGKKTDLVGRYLTTRINKVLVERNLPKNSSNKVTYILGLFLFFI